MVRQALFSAEIELKPPTAHQYFCDVYIHSHVETSNKQLEKFPQRQTQRCVLSDLTQTHTGHILYAQCTMLWFFSSITQTNAINLACKSGQC